jgi:hypothetical protein
MELTMILFGVLFRGLRLLGQTAKEGAPCHINSLNGVRPGIFRKGCFQPFNGMAISRREGVRASSF